MSHGYYPYYVDVESIINTSDVIIVSEGVVDVKDVTTLYSVNKYTFIHLF